MKKIIAILSVLIMMNTSMCFADSNGTTSKSFIVNLNDDEATMQEVDITGADNSLLPVKVIRYTNNIETTIFTGELGDYDDGAWADTDFSNIQFLVIYNWENEDVIYIIPTSAQKTDDLNLSEDMSISDEASVQSRIVLQNNSETELIEYNITYNIATNENGTSISVNYSVSNGYTEGKTVTLIASLYTGNVLNNISTKSLYVSASGTQTDSITMPVANPQTQNIKLLVWENFNTMRPIGIGKMVKDLENYQREKNIYYTANANKEIKLFMNADNSKGSNNGAVHTISYDTSKLQPIDLCSFTYEKELSSGTISDAGVSIENVDLTAGVIKYRFENCFSERYTGINNIVKFKTLADLTDEEITYTIQ